MSLEADVGQHRSNDLKPKSPNFQPARRDVGRLRPLLVRNPAEVRQLWPTSCPISTEFGPNSANVFPISTSFGPPAFEAQVNALMCMSAWWLPEQRAPTTARPLLTAHYRPPSIDRVLLASIAGGLQCLCHCPPATGFPGWPTATDPSVSSLKTSPSDRRDRARYPPKRHPWLPGRSALPGSAWKSESSDTIAERTRSWSAT